MTEMNASAAEIARAAPFEVEDVFWGYKIRPRASVPFGVMFGQALSFFLGVCLMTATVGVLVLPILFFDGGVGIMRVGAATLMGAVAFYLLWFASRGTMAELHVDTREKEIRSVVCNRSGKPTTLSAFAFDEIGGVDIEPDKATGQEKLVLRYSDTAHMIPVAYGSKAQLVPLRARIALDLLGTDRVAGTKAA